MVDVIKADIIKNFCSQRLPAGEGARQGVIFVTGTINGTDLASAPQCGHKIDDVDLAGFIHCDHLRSDEAHCPVAQKYAGH